MAIILLSDRSIHIVVINVVMTRLMIVEDHQRWLQFNFNGIYYTSSNLYKWILLFNMYSVLVFMADRGNASLVKILISSHLTQCKVNINYIQPQGMLDCVFWIFLSFTCSTFAILLQLLISKMNQYDHDTIVCSFLSVHVDKHQQSTKRLQHLTSNCSSCRLKFRLNNWFKTIFRKWHT